MQATALQADQLAHWIDLWIAPDKRAGYVGTANENYQMLDFHSFRGRKQIIEATQGIPDRYITLNAFNVNWKDIAHSRNASNLKQIRNIGIDLDQYKLGISIEAAKEELHRLVSAEIIPIPNLVSTSRGLQLFYSIRGGASPYCKGLTSYITGQFIERLKHLGADGNAKDVARLMRVPESVNSRNGATVRAELWRNETYTLQELQAYIEPYTPAKKTSIIIPFSKATGAMLKTNRARLDDFDKLLELRDYDLTHKRNIMLYNYAFHLTLLQADQSKGAGVILASVNSLFRKVKTTDASAKPLTDTEIYTTAASAIEDAAAFITWYTANDLKGAGFPNDGIIKPKKTSTLISELDITPEEQRHMKTLADQEIKAENRRRRDREAKTEKNRAKGIRPMTEYNQVRAEDLEKKVEQLRMIVEAFPEYTQAQCAEMMRLSQQTIARLMKKL
jgi:hypothetical protein